MALWNIGNRPAGTVPDGKGNYVPATSVITDLDAAPAIVVNPNKNGVTSSVKNSVVPATTKATESKAASPVSVSKKEDPYGGQPIQISTGNSASSVLNNTVSGVLSSGNEGLFDLIKENTDNNNAWSAAQAGRQMDFQERMNDIAQEFNAGEAAKNRDWQEYMSNTAHQREVADLKAAGLNPVLSASGGNGASVGSGSSASISSPTGAKGDTDTSANSALVSLYGALINAQTQMANANLSARTNLAIADKQIEAQMYGSQLAAEASKYAAGTAYAASAYASDNNLTNSREQRQYDADHPKTATQGLTSLFGTGGVSSAIDKAKDTPLGKELAKFGNYLLGRGA